MNFVNKTLCMLTTDIFNNSNSYKTTPKSRQNDESGVGGAGDGDGDGDGEPRRHAVVDNYAAATTIRHTSNISHK